jgi:hypothetical protein
MRRTQAGAESTQMMETHPSRGGVDPDDGGAAEVWPDGRDAGAESTQMMETQRRCGRMAGTPERSRPR